MAVLNSRYELTKCADNTWKAVARMVGLIWTAAMCIAWHPIATEISNRRADDVEYRFKAVYFLNFLQLVEWPDSSFSSGDSPMVVGVFGNDPFGKTLDEVMENERVNGRMIVIKRFSQIDQITSCHALFVGVSDRRQLSDVLLQITHGSTLTISDRNGFADVGVGINFYLEQGKIRFEINIDALRRARLHASSKLLRLARIVDRSNGD